MPVLKIRREVFSASRASDILTRTFFLLSSFLLFHLNISDVIHFLRFPRPWPVPLDSPVSCGLSSTTRFLTRPNLWRCARSDFGYSRSLAIRLTREYCSVIAPACRFSALPAVNFVSPLHASPPVHCSSYIWVQRTQSCSSPLFPRRRRYRPGKTSRINCSFSPGISDSVLPPKPHVQIVLMTRFHLNLHATSSPFSCKLLLREFPARLMMT